MFKMLPINYLLTNHIYLIYIYKDDLAFNNLQELICHKTKPKQARTLIGRRLYPSSEIQSAYSTVSANLVDVMVNEPSYFERIRFFLDAL